MSLMMQAMMAASRRRAFNPLSLSPALWLDFSDSTTLFDATSGGSLPGNGVGIARVEDKSGNGRNFTQATSGARPTRQTGVQNGLPVARFDGTDDILIGNAAALDILRDKPGGSILACYRWISNNTSTNRTVINISAASDTASRLTLRVNIVSSRKMDFGGRRQNSDSLQSVQTAQNEPASCFIHAGIASYQASTLRQYVNNSLDGSTDTFQLSGNSEDANSTIVSIGSVSPGVLSPANIDFSELFVFDRAISDADRNALHNYLAAKWGIPTFDPDAADYFARAEALGGSFDQTAIDPTYGEAYVKGAISDMIAGLKADGVWSKITELYLLTGVSFGGLMAKMKHAGTAVLTNNGPFVAADYLAAGSGAGLIGNKTNKWLNTSASAGSQNNLSFSVYAVEPGTLSVTDQSAIGNSGSQVFFGRMTNSRNMTLSIISLGDRIPKYAISHRTDSNNQKATVNGVTTTQAHSSSTFSSSNWYLFAFNNNGTASLFSDCRLTCAHIGSGLTSTEATNLSLRINALMTALGCNVYNNP